MRHRLPLVTGNGVSPDGGLLYYGTDYTDLYRRAAAYVEFPEHCADGGLAGYGTRLSSLFRHAARMLAKVMAGTRPADIPYEQPIMMELCLNIQTAKALGLTVPPSILARADEVIE